MAERRGSRVRARRRKVVEGEFRSPSTVCLSVSVIYMQMAACMSEGREGGRDAFLF